MKKILVIGAHPDDEIIGCGGTLNKLAAAGNEIYAYILTDGHSSRSDYKLTEDDVHILRERENAAIESAKLLGFKDTIIDKFPDQGLDTVAFTNIVKSIEKQLKEIKPGIVFTHHRGDLNLDHKIVYEATLTACRPAGDYYPEELYSYETFSSTEWGSPFPESAFIPNYFVDISDNLQKKMNSLELYGNEMKKYPHPRSPEGIKESALRWGKVINKTAAEAFILIRKIVKN